MKVYIAAPFFNERQLEIVRQVENELAKCNIDHFSPRSQGKSLKDMTREETLIARTEVYASNIREMELCDVVVACVEEKDTGTSFELGYFAKSEKKIILFSEKIDRVNVMLAEAAFGVCDDIEMLKHTINGSYNAEINDLI
jgi:nucleoside 2-deoxyribosyltransferase